jgi:uncharacterized delta-60 repeat protein
MKAITAFVILLISSFSLNAQVTQDWVARYNGGGDSIDIPYAMAVDRWGNVYVAGKTQAKEDYYNSDYFTVKYNSAGVLQWVQTYNGPADSTDVATAIAVDNLGYVYVTGYSRGGIATDPPDIVTIKYNPAGALQWLDRHINLGGSYPTCIALDNSGFIYVSGQIWNPFIIAIAMSTIKYNSSGGVEFVTQSEGNYASSMNVDAYGNVYVTGPGDTRSNGTTGMDYTTIKYNSSGLQQWIAYYDYGLKQYGRDEPTSLAIDGSGNVYVTGKSEGENSLDDYATIKYNSSGVQEWVARYNGPCDLSDWANAIAVDEFSNVYVTGRSCAEYVTIKYNSNGVQQWIAKYNHLSGTMEAYAIALDASGSVYVTGSGYYAALEDFCTVKYNSSGELMWEQQYNGPGNSVDIPNSIIIDSSNNVYVTGISAGSGTLEDFATIKYSQPTGIEEVQIIALQIYPNPASDIFTLTIDRNSNADLTLNIYNVMGSIVKTGMLNQNQKQINVGDLSSGIYMVEIKSQGLTGNHKLIIQR